MKNWRLFVNILLFTLTHLNSFAQKELRNEWYIGSPNSKLIFNKDTAVLKLLNSKDSTFPKASSSCANICDSNGELLFATNSYTIFYKNGDEFKNGNQINTDSFNWYNGLSAYTDNAIVLPKSNNKYYLFICTQSDAKVTDFVNNGGDFDFDEIIYSVIDMNADSGKGAIISNRNLLLKTTELPWINKTNFTACRHANGRDWWLIKPSARGRNIRYKFLVTPDSIYKFIDTEPERWSSFTYDNIGQSCFSADGNWYAECNSNSPHTIYNFDRCSGQFTFNKLIDMSKYSVLSSNRWDGVCFSPDSRFLYTSDGYYIYQIDLQEPNDSVAVKLVSVLDTTNFPKYSTMQLTPSGQILMGNFGWVINTLNGIMEPNLLGIGCKFKQDYIVSNLPFKNYPNLNAPIGEPPNMPFYGLGALEGSGCDTIRPPVPIPVKWLLYPNPAQQNILLQIPNSQVNATVQIAIMDMLGQTLQYKNYSINSNYQIEIPLTVLANGVYLLKAVYGANEFVGKFVKE